MEDDTMHGADEAHAAVVIQKAWRKSVDASADVAETPRRDGGGVEGRKTSDELFREKEKGRGEGLAYLGMDAHYGPHNNPYAPPAAGQGNMSSPGAPPAAEEGGAFLTGMGADDEEDAAAPSPAADECEYGGSAEEGSEAEPRPVPLEGEALTPQPSDVTDQRQSKRRKKKKDKKLESPRTIEARKTEAVERQRLEEKARRRQERVEARKKREAVLRARQRKEELLAESPAAPTPSAAAEPTHEEEQKLLMKHLRDKEVSERRERRLEEEAKRKKERQRAQERQKRAAVELEKKLAAEREEQRAALGDQERQQREDRLRRVQERSKEAEMRGQRGNHELRKVLKQKPYHVVIQERADEAMRQEEKKREEAMKRIREEARRPLNYRDMISEHEQKCNLLQKKAQEQEAPEKRKPPAHLAPMPSVYHGKSHELVQQEMQAAKEQRLRLKEEQGARRKRMQNFASLVKEMYPPARPHTNPPHASPSRLPPVRAGAASAEPQPHRDPLLKKRKGDAYLRNMLDDIRAHPKPLAAEPGPELAPRPKRCERDLRGDRYLRDALKHNKPHTQHPQEINDEERAKHLRQLRKRAAKLAANISPDQAAEDTANQKYFAAIAAKMDLLLALDP